MGIFRTFIFTTLVLYGSKVMSSELNTTKHKLLVFSGSDWCLPCIKLSKEILTTDEFADFAHRNLELIKADFPQRKEIPAAQVKRNEELAEKYNPQGEFPKVLLLSADGKVISVIDHNRQTTASFISQIKKHLPQSELKELRKEAKLMGCRFEFTVVSDTEENGWEYINQSIRETERIENLISEWKKTSAVSVVNAQAGKGAIEVPEELYQLIERSLTISKITQGAFDITFQGMNDIWEFDQQILQKMPTQEEIQNRLAHVGFEKIQNPEPNKIFLPEPEMAIGFGAIGKGYAADKVKQILMDQGIKSGVINASGDLIAWGERSDGTPWKVGIADPENPDEVLFWLPVRNKAVATSGNYEKYFEFNGDRYAHIINPKTGYPVKNVKSVTVISPSAELSDALATAVFVMGVEVGIDFIEQMPDVQCLIIDNKNQVHTSSDLKLNNLSP